MLVRLEKECGNIPSYWYYRADAAHDAMGKGADNDKLALDIKFCLDRYRELAGTLRKDNTLASLLMLHLATADMSPDEARAEIAQVVDPFPLDPSKRLFAALTSLRYGFIDDAIEHLNANLDMRKYEVVSRKLLSDIYEKRKDVDRETSLLRKLLDKDAASNQELLYHLGRIPATDKFIKEIGPRIETINVQVKPGVMGKDDVEIVMPMKWEIVENSSVPATMKIDGKEIRSSEMEMTKDGNICIGFKDAVKDSELAAMRIVPVTAKIETRHFPVVIVGELAYPEKQDGKDQCMMSRIKCTAKQFIPRSEGKFRLLEIDCEDIVLRNEGGKWVGHRAGKDSQETSSDVQ